ncbi:MAG: hypothetical protein AB1500_07705 [Bacillota bacterium]
MKFWEIEKPVEVATPYCEMRYYEATGKLEVTRIRRLDDGERRKTVTLDIRDCERPEIKALLQKVFVNWGVFKGV